jgi:hypothetical protein
LFNAGRRHIVDQTSRSIRTLRIISFLQLLW